MTFTTIVELQYICSMYVHRPLSIDYFDVGDRVLSSEHEHCL